MISISKCPACVGKLEFVFDVWAGHQTMKVWRCKQCRNYVKSPFFSSEELAEVYRHYDIHEQHYEPAQGELDNIAARLDRIERFVKRRGALLEIGCGRGFFLNEALKRGWRVEGIEFEGSAARHLLKSVEEKVKFIRTEKDFQNLPEQSFEVITSYQVFEHLTQPVASLKAWSRALRSSGLMVIQTPHAGSLGAKFNGSNWIHHKKKEHFVIYSKKALEMLYRLNGFKIIHEYFGGPPFFITGMESKLGFQKPPSVTSIYRFRWMTNFARNLVYQLGVGDNIEIFGKKSL